MLSSLSENVSLDALVNSSLQEENCFKKNVEKLGKQQTFMQREQRAANSLEMLNTKPRSLPQRKKMRELALEGYAANGVNNIAVKVDEMRSEVETLRTQSSTDYQTLVQRVENIEADVKLIQEKVESIETDMKLIQEKVESIEADVKLIQEKVKSIKADVKLIQEKVKSIDVKLIQEKVESIEADVKLIQELLKKSALLHKDIPASVQPDAANNQGLSGEPQSLVSWRDYYTDMREANHLGDKEMLVALPRHAALPVYKKLQEYVTKKNTELSRLGLGRLEPTRLRTCWDDLTSGEGQVRCPPPLKHKGRYTSKNWQEEVACPANEPSHIALVMLSFYAHGPADLKYLAREFIQMDVFFRENDCELKLTRASGRVVRR